MRKVLTWLQKRLETFWDWLFPRPSILRWKACLVDDFPDDDDYQPYTVYIVGEEEHLWFVSMLCPCGCSKVLYMSLLEKDYPRWSIEVHPDRTVSLTPSVWRRVGCGSHFFLKKGLIQWCGS